jgi:hypothetical protein
VKAGQRAKARYAPFEANGWSLKDGLARWGEHLGGGGGGVMTVVYGEPIPTGTKTWRAAFGHVGYM